MEKTIGKFICELRKAKGMTQKDLAELLNVSDKTISRWERDETVPDLALLPVMAEIFDVSMDELILGEKSVHEKENFDDVKKMRGAKLDWILKKKKAAFYALCVISLSFCLSGILGGAICRFGFSKNILSFCVACICFVFAAACQIISYILAKYTDDIGGLDDEKIKSFSLEIKKMTINVFCVILLCVVFCLPLLFDFCINLIVINADRDMLLPHIDKVIVISRICENWLRTGSIMVGVCLITFIGGVAIITKDRRKLKYISKFTIIAAVTFLLFSAIIYIPPYWICKGDTVETYSDFGVYMRRIPESMSDRKVQLLTRDEDFVQQLLDDDGTVLFEYEPFNEDVERIEYGNNKKLPITLYTKQHYTEVRKTLSSIKKLWLIAVLVEGLCVFLSYKSTKKKEL